MINSVSRILVVDDGEENRQLASLFIKRAGLQVDTAENGQIAVDKVSSEHYDMVLMDMQMPVMDGITATRTIRELGHTMPIYALTANVMQDDKRRCAEAGCDGFLTKPINIKRLMEALAAELATADKSSDQESDAALASS